MVGFRDRLYHLRPGDVPIFNWDLELARLRVFSLVWTWLNARAAHSVFSREKALARARRAFTPTFNFMQYAIYMEQQNIPEKS